MSIRNILVFPDPRLRTCARAVEKVDREIRRLVDDMFETMYDAGGVGLAATQIDVHRRVLVADVSPEQDEPRAFINPELSIIDPAPREFEEGCLSVPGFRELVRRPCAVKVRALNEHGEAFEEDLEGLLSVCVQHEIDHLDGKLFVDYLSDLKRGRIRDKLKKQAAQNTVGRDPEHRKKTLAAANAF